MPVLSSVLAIALLSACAAQGVPYAQHAASHTPVPAGQSRIVVIRLHSVLEAPIPARLELDGSPLPQLYETGYLVRELRPGTHWLNVTGDQTDGDCQLPFEVASARTAYFLVAPRPENRNAAIGWSLWPSWSQQTEALSDLLSIAGPAFESFGERCRGTFSIAPIPAATAERHLTGLRESVR